MAMTIKAGRVPGAIATLVYSDGEQPTVFQALERAAKEYAETHNGNTFSVSRDPYHDEKADVTRIDVPQLNAVPLGTKTDDGWIDIQWDTLCNDGDTVLVVPEIQGN